MLGCDVGELVVPVGLAVESLLLQPSDGIVLCLVVDAEMSRLIEKEDEVSADGFTYAPGFSRKS